MLNKIRNNLYVIARFLMTVAIMAWFCYSILITHWVLTVGIPAVENEKEAIVLQEAFSHYDKISITREHCEDVYGSTPDTLNINEEGALDD